MLISILNTGSLKIVLATQIGNRTGTTSRLTHGVSVEHLICIGNHGRKTYKLTLACLTYSLILGLTPMGKYISLLILLFWSRFCRSAQAPGCGVRKILPTSRIIGGETAFPNSWPWMAYIELGPASHQCASLCGGSLIAPQWVLTAGHCLYTPEYCPDQRKWKVSEISVFLGVHDREDLKGTVKRGVEKAIYHRDYHHPNHDSDIALLKLSSPVQYSDRISPLCMANVPGIVSDGARCMVTGWGLTAAWSRVPSRYLMEVLVTYTSAATCRATSKYTAAQITNTMICAEDPGKDSCSGDSGGPLICPFPTSSGNVWKQIGVVSWGRGCALPNYPGVYANVSVFYEWIRTTTNMGVDCKQFGCDQYCSQQDPRFPPVCYCQLGYTLQPDHKSCKDINECAGTHGCSDICVNTPGSFKCECNSGRTLSNDLKTCAASQRFVCPRPARPLHGFDTCQQDRYLPGDTCLQTCISSGFVLEGKSRRECGQDGIWTPPVAKCRDINECSKNNGGCEQKCYNYPGGFSCGCNSGFELDNNGRTCKDITPPVFTKCPGNVNVPTLPGMNHNVVNLEPVQYSDNVKAHLVTGPGAQVMNFSIGIHTVKYVIADDAGNTAQCSYTVTVRDDEKPKIKNCPSSLTRTVENNIRRTRVSWDDLDISDNSGNFTVHTNAPQDRLFSVGSYRIIYTAMDPSRNSEECQFDVNITVSARAVCPPLQAPSNADVLCYFALGVTYCVIQCKTGFIQPVQNHIFYLCTMEGKWTPTDSAQGCIPAK
ncbi:uncharacterized protein LOC106151855 [Lingula anatina]|uniref:Uncharacterized protein LOC106151855 n=1 Tax=Lingula anatina TaxID=7574 RepID=A0A1S3H446_LINAN|nr:uncharacterized protein LOC106151855 [Lingula anatina]|eukprot:XP_013380732.1 uncharacterized protein LOC106151855 [Lingula anatina]